MTSKKSLIKTKWKMLQSVGMKSFSEKPPSITVWFMVALAARKFQRYESNKYKMSLRHFFDRESAIKELSQLQLSKIDKTGAVKLAYLIRKFELTFKDLPFGSEILVFTIASAKKATLTKRILACLTSCAFHSSS